MTTVHRPEQAVLERMVETLDALRPRSLELLHVIADRSVPATLSVAAAASDPARSINPAGSVKTVEMDWNELALRGLVGPYPITTTSTPDLAARLTRFGRDFAWLLGLEG